MGMERKRFVAPHVISIQETLILPSDYPVDTNWNYLGKIKAEMPSKKTRTDFDAQLQQVITQTKEMGEMCCSSPTSPAAQLQYVWTYGGKYIMQTFMIL